MALYNLNTPDKYFYEIQQHLLGLLQLAQAVFGKLNDLLTVLVTHSTQLKQCHGRLVYVVGSVDGFGLECGSGKPNQVVEQGVDAILHKERPGRIQVGKTIGFANLVQK